MIRLATQQEAEKYIKDDPVRPHISLDWRTQKRREVYVLENNGSIDAVVCVAYTSWAIFLSKLCITYCITKNWTPEVCATRGQFIIFYS